MHRLTTATIANKGLLMTAIPLVLLLTFVGLVVHVKRQSESAQTWALHSIVVLGASQPLAAHIAEAESAVRGYVITGDTDIRRVVRPLVGAGRADSHAATIVGQRQSVAGSQRAVGSSEIVVQRMARLTEIVRLINAR